MYALYIVGVNKSCIRTMDGLKMTFYVLFSCSIIFLINALVRSGGISSIPSISAATDVVLLALIPTLVSDFTLILAVQRVGSTTTAILGCMEPMTAVTMGFLFLGEAFGINQLIGIAVILSAVTTVVIANNPDNFKKGLKLLRQLIKRK